MFSQRCTKIFQHFSYINEFITNKNYSWFLALVFTNLENLLVYVYARSKTGSNEGISIKVEVGVIRKKKLFAGDLFLATISSG